VKCFEDVVGNGTSSSSVLEEALSLEASASLVPILTPAVANVLMPDVLLSVNSLYPKGVANLVRSSMLQVFQL
jgi:hypothetical protein